MNTPLVSIIIPIYNVEEFLPECLDSVITQTYQNLEIILINDESPDNSDAICLEYAKKDSRLLYLKQKNAGLSAARNHGIRVAKGEYLFFLDSDDYISPTCIHDLVQGASTGNLPVIGFKIDFSDKGEIATPKQGYGTYSSVKDFLLDFHRYFATKSNFAWGKLYRTDIIRDNKIVFSEGVSLVEDILFNIQYYKCCNCGVVMLLSNGYYYRQHGTGTLSKKFNPKMFDWNELGYSTIRDCLNEYGVMTDANRSHFYNNVFGNLLYSIGLLIKSDKYSKFEKQKIIKKYISTPLAKEVFLYQPPASIENRLAWKNLSRGRINAYIMTSRLFNFLRNLKHALS